MKLLRIAAHAAARVCAACAVAIVAVFAAAAPLAALSPSQSQAMPEDPRAVYQALNDLRPDGEHVYTVHEVDFRCDVVSMKLGDGKLAFFEPIGGRITGAVFTGVGHILATPRDRGERRSLAQYLGVPILDQSFSRAYFRFTDNTAAELQRLLSAEGAAAASDRDFAQSWAATVANLNPSQSLRVMYDLLSTNPQPYFYAGIGGDPAGAFDVLIDGRRDEQVLLGRTHLVSGVPVYDVWASFHSMDGAAAPFRPFAPLDYRVETTIAEDLSIQGKTSVHLKALRGGERIVGLELSRNLAVEQVQAADGRALEYFQNEELSRREILRRGNDFVLVALPAAAAAGDELHFDIRYRGSVIADAGNGVKFVGEHETWYAHLADSDAFVPFELSFRWPRRLTLVATGHEVESHDDGATRSGRWVSELPFEVAGFNLGEYNTQNAGNERLPIKIYANKQLEEAILERLRESASELVEPPAQVFNPRRPGSIFEAPAPPPPPSPASVMKSVGGQILESVGFFEKLNGAFPFDQLDVSQIPGTFGQGWPGLVYLSTLAFLPAEAQARAGLGERAQEEAQELMAPHEVAHQWWGNVVDAASYRDIWIMEGMANYFALMWVESKKPGTKRLETWLERYRKELTTRAQGAADAPDDAGPLTLGMRLHSSKIPDAYDAVVYGKATWVMHMLREMLRDPAAKDPDARFRGLLRAILSDYRFRPFSTADFQREVEKKMTPAMDLEGTRKMDWFFDEWVRATGIPRYKVEFQVKPRGTEFVVSGKLMQTGVDDVFTAPVPLYAAHPGGKPTLLGVVDTTGPETRFHFVTRAHPSRVVIDPRLTLLRQID